MKAVAALAVVALPPPDTAPSAGAADAAGTLNGRRVQAVGIGVPVRP